MNVFHVLAGANKEILNASSRTDRIKIAGLGSLILIPSTMGFFSMSYAVSTLTNESWIYYSIGAAWFFTILIIDRFIVSGFFKSDMITAQYWIAAMVRIIFAVLIGIAVSHPMILLWFGKSLEEQMYKDLEKQKSAYRIENQKKKESRDKKFREIENKKNCYEKLITYERNGIQADLDCGVSSGIRNKINGKNPYTEGFIKDLDSLKKQLSKIDIENRFQDSVDIVDMNKKVESLENNFSRDYLKRVQKLEELEKDPESGGHVSLVKLFLMLFFIFLDTLPVSLKLFTSISSYESLAFKETKIIDNKVKADIKIHQAYADSLYESSQKVKQETNQKICEIKSVFNQTFDFMKILDDSVEEYETTINKMTKNLSKTKNKKTKEEKRKAIDKLENLYQKSIEITTKKMEEFLNKQYEQKSPN